LWNPRAVRLAFVIFGFKDSVGALEASGWAKCARSSACHGCNVVPKQAISGTGVVAGGGHDQLRAAGVAELARIRAGVEMVGPQRLYSMVRAYCDYIHDAVVYVR
jgi:hypothetical protein